MLFSPPRPLPADRSAASARPRARADNWEGALQQGQESPVLGPVLSCLGRTLSHKEWI